MSEEKDIPPDENPKEQPSKLKSAGNDIPLDEPVAGLTELSTFNINPSTSENMEVHAHTHSGHGKKT